MEQERKCRAQVAYEAYGDYTDNKNHLGLEMPTWDELPAPIQMAWAAASVAVTDDFISWGRNG